MYAKRNKKKKINLLHSEGVHVHVICCLEVEDKSRFLNLSFPRRHSLYCVYCWVLVFYSRCVAVQVLDNFTLMWVFQ